MIEGRTRKAGQDRGRLRATVKAKEIALAALVLALSFIFPAFAASPGAQGKSGFDQEWSKLIADAKKEGTVAVASGGAPSRQYRPIMDVFQKKFGVTVEVSTGSATDTVNRLLAERKGGRYTTDVALISHREQNQRLIPSESLVPFAPLLIHPEVADGSGWYLGRHWYGDKAVKVPIYLPCLPGDPV